MYEQKPMNNKRELYLKINKQLPWLICIVVFGLLLLTWAGLAAATSLKSGTGVQLVNTSQSLFHPENTSFSITIGAIVLLSIIISSAIFHPSEGG